MYYIGLDVHKKTISYCVKDVSGQVYAQGTLAATRAELDHWMKTLPQPWTAAMEATIFTGWIYDHLLPHAAQVKVAHPLMLRAIAAAKKKNDRIDASKIADCLRCDFLPECYTGLLLETGVSHNKQRLHKVGTFGNCSPLTQRSRRASALCCNSAGRPSCGCREQNMLW
jgi:transposase